MALKIEEIMDLSLDEYIAISKQSASNDVTGDKTHESINNDYKFDRRKGNIDEDEDDGEDFLMQPLKALPEKTHKINGADIWKGPPSSIAYLDCNDQRNDLREKINNNSNKLNPKISAVQYRIMAPNNAGNRPRGIPTLLPLDIQVNNRNWLNNRGNKRKGGNHCYNNTRRNFNNAKNNYVNARNEYGRVQRNRKDFESKNLSFSIARNNSNNNLDNSINSYTTAQNMWVETPSSCINLASSPPLSSCFQMIQQAVPEHHCSSRPQSLPIGNLTPQAAAVLNLNSLGAQSTPSAAGNGSGSGSESLKSLLGFQGNVSSEMMPVFASRLMDFIQSGIQNPVVHKPVYDMKIQKDIHEIQKKPLLYKCPGGEVVSSDGAGVNCKIIPRTSGVSLNCRFA